MKTITLKLKDTSAMRRVLAYLRENVTTQEMENATAHSDDDPLYDDLADAWSELDSALNGAISPEGVKNSDHQLFRVVRGPYLMMVGTNGQKTHAVQVESLLSKEECEKSGRKHDWPVTAANLRRSLSPEYYGMKEPDLQALIQELERLDESGSPDSSGV